MRLQLPILSILLLFSWGSVSAADCPEVSYEMSQLIKKHADKIEGAEYCRARKVYKDASSELVLYSISGACFGSSNYLPDSRQPAEGACGNSSYWYMLARIDGETYPPMKIGGRGVFLPKDIKREGHKVIISGLSYADHDPLCEVSYYAKLLTETFDLSYPILDLLCIISCMDTFYFASFYAIFELKPLSFSFFLRNKLNLMVLD